MVSPRSPDDLRKLAEAAAAAHKESPEAAARALHSLGEALEPQSQSHARAAFAASIRATHDVRSAMEQQPLSALTVSMQRDARARRVGLPSGSWERSEAQNTIFELHERQHPLDCSKAPLLLVPIWPCCEGLASIAHTLAAALAQAQWTGATMLPFLAGCEQPGDARNQDECEMTGSAGLLHGLLPITHCTIATALDDAESAALTSLVTAIGDSPEARPREATSAAALLLPPGLQRRAALGEMAARCALAVMTNEHFADAAALVAPRRMKDVSPVCARATCATDDRERAQNLLWLGALTSYVLTPHPQVSSELAASLSRHTRMQGLMAAIHVRHGDKTYEPWKAPWKPLKAYLRAAATSVGSLGRMTNVPSRSREAEGSPTLPLHGGSLFVASDNATLLSGLRRTLLGRKASEALPTHLRYFKLLELWAPRTEGSTLPRLRPDLKTHRSAPSVTFFSGAPTLQQNLRIAALQDLLALSESSVFVGTASSHYSSVAGVLRCIRGKVGKLLRKPSADGHVSQVGRVLWPPGSPPVYVDENKLALAGAYSVGLLHSANLGPGESASRKAARWAIAARRLEESAPPVDARQTINTDRVPSRSPSGECRVSLPHAIRWQHSPGPVPAGSRKSLTCVWYKLIHTCPSWASWGAWNSANGTSLDQQQNQEYRDLKHGVKGDS